MKNTKLPTFSDLLNLAIQRVKPIYWKLMGINLAAWIVCLPISIFFFLNSDRFSSSISLGEVDFVVLFVTLSAISMFVGFWGKLAQKYFIVKKKISIATAYRESLNLVFPLLYIYLLTYFFLLPTYLFFLIPALIILVRLWFTDWILIVDGSRGFSALMKSRLLSKGMFWPVLWRILLPWFLLFIVIIFLSIGISSYSHNIQSPLVSLAVTLLEMAVFPFMMQYDYELFSILRKRRSTSTIQTLPTLRYKILLAIGVLMAIMFAGILVLNFLSPEFLNIPADPTHGGLLPVT